MLDTCFAEFNPIIEVLAIKLNAPVAPLQRAKEQRSMAFLFVNNRLEGNSPLTIMAVTEPD